MHPQKPHARHLQSSQWSEAKSAEQKGWQSGASEPPATVDLHAAAKVAVVPADTSAGVTPALTAPLFCAQNGQPRHLHHAQCSLANAAPHHPKQPTVVESPSMLEEQDGAAIEQSGANRRFSAIGLTTSVIDITRDACTTRQSKLGREKRVQWPVERRLQ